MLENPPKEASFDHVDNNGDLIFIFENTPLKIHVDDTLERAIAESKKLTNVGGDNQNTVNSIGKSDDSPAATTATLPISQIQALIRAGVDPEHVAKRYNVSESQVKRFSSGVETEKQYAIEQFLTVPAPKQSNMRTISDLIERTLAKAHIGMETVKWRATRRGLEPWLITAEFNTATRTIKAEWTWNMHDNSITCANPSSRLLLGEEIMNNDSSSKKSQFGGAYRDTVSINFPFANDELPGNSIRSARIERAVSQWESRNSVNLANVAIQTEAAQKEQNSNNTNNSLDGYTENPILSDLVSNSTPSNNPDNTEQSSANVKNIEAAETAANIANSSSNSGIYKSKENSENEDSSENTSANISQDNSSENAVVDSSKSASAKSKYANSKSNTFGSDSEDAHVQADKTVAIETPKTEPKQHMNEHTRAKKSTRAAVPSWDEILFGEA
ncbi:MAG: septation protein SepH [Gardnerella vaginalis]|nr:septation protein SepH [Gardnerella vaginalis]MDK8327679.1 septation protein SepH [Gardnerella vaginalis]